MIKLHCCLAGLGSDKRKNGEVGSSFNQALQLCEGHSSLGMGYDLLGRQSCDQEGISDILEGSGKTKVNEPDSSKAFQRCC